MPQAMKLDRFNIPAVIITAQLEEFDLSYLWDEVSYNAEEYGEVTYLFRDGSYETNNRTYTAMTGSGLDQSWKFAETEHPDQWCEVERL